MCSCDVSLIIKTNLQNNCLQTNKHSTRFNHCVVIPVQIQASTAEYTFTYELVPNSCHTRSNYRLLQHALNSIDGANELSYPFKYRLLQQRYLIGYRSRCDSCHTRSNTGFYNRARNLRKPYSWLSYPFKYRLLQRCTG